MTDLPAASFPPPSARSQRGLDGLNFFIATVQTGFGAFVAVYLTSQAWTLRDIGDVLTFGTIAAVASQIPAGALVDAAHSKRAVAGISLTGVALSALIYAFHPTWLPVVLAEMLHGFASCILGPSVAALSLQLVGRTALGERLGRNTGFGAMGNGLAAGLFGACGTYLSPRSVFYLATLFTIPALLSLTWIGPPRVTLETPQRKRLDLKATLVTLGTLFSDRRLLMFGGCVMLFHFANAAMLPLAASEVTTDVGSYANLVVAACIVMPQFVVAGISRPFGRLADRRGRRLVLIFGFAALPVRAFLLSLATKPEMLVVVQMLDGISGASFGIMLPLIAADLAGGSGHYNMVLGTLGVAIATGGALSTAIAGAVAQQYGPGTAFAMLAVAGLCATLLVVLAMPETRPKEA